jgi:hypothetical protein
MKSPLPTFKPWKDYSTEESGISAIAGLCLSIWLAAVASVRAAMSESDRGRAETTRIDAVRLIELA